MATRCGRLPSTACWAAPASPAVGSPDDVGVLAEVDDRDDDVGLGVRTGDVEDAKRKSVNESSPNWWINFGEEERRFADQRRGLLELVEELETKEWCLGVVISRGLQDVCMSSRR